MLPGFVSVYKNKNDGLPHIYFYPGYDDYDRNIYRIDLTSKQYLDYKYVKNQDRSIEYIIVNVTSGDMSFVTIENQTKKTKEYAFKIEDLIEI